MRMNKLGVAGVGHEPKSRVGGKPAAAKGGSEVGGERKADVKGVQEGGSKAEAAGSPLRGAVAELHKQHPIKHDDLGPHHGPGHHHRVK